jgi:cytochrome P450
MERQALADDVIGGFHIPRGSSVVISPYVTHRHPGFWTDPLRFDADRFDERQAAERAPHAYLPFGAGQRLCIGSNFAMVEALVILSMVLARYQLALLPGHPVEPKPGITLRIAQGLPMILRAWPAGQLGGAD